jgi:hypothetical protein
MGGLAGLRGRILGAAALVLVALSSMGAAAEPGLRSVDQGPAWTPEARTRFYSQDQGSLVIPLRWITVLREPGDDAGGDYRGVARLLRQAWGDATEWDQWR